MAKILALLNTQGTAMPRTAICADGHWSKSYKEILRHATFIKEWDRLDFVDVSSDALLLKCLLCGATGGDGNS